MNEMNNKQMGNNCTPDEIRHSGIVKNTDEKFVYVSILAHSACDACHAKGVCNVSDLKEEILEIPQNNNSDYKAGDDVEVLMEKSLGTMAVLLGYLIPFIILLITLITSLYFMESEGFAALISIGILIPYYMILYYNRGKLKKTFVFRIK